MTVYRASYTAPQNMTDDEYASLRRRYDAYSAARGERTFISGEDALSMPKALTNDEISAIERYEFIRDRPATYFAYVSDRTVTIAVASRTHTATVTTWTGEKLGEATLGNSYHSNMGDRRRAIRVHAINGAEYVGTYYSGAGDYCRLKMTAASARRLARKG